MLSLSMPDHFYYFYFVKKLFEINKMDNEQLTSDLSDRDKTILDLEKRAKLADVKTKKQMSEL